jgi:hypothetical protein
MGQAAKAYGAFCEVCGAERRAGEPCPDCAARPRAFRRHNEDLVRSLGITSLVLGIATAGAMLRGIDGLLPWHWGVIPSALLAALPALLGAVFGAKALRRGRRTGAAAWPYAAAGLVLCLLVLWRYVLGICDYIL